MLSSLSVVNIAFSPRCQHIVIEVACVDAGRQRISRSTRHRCYVPTASSGRIALVKCYDDNSYVSSLPNVNEVAVTKARGFFMSTDVTVDDTTTLTEPQSVNISIKV